MNEASSLLEELKGLEGHEISFTDEHEIEKGMIKRFAMAIEDPNPMYRDEEFANPYGGIIAPPTFLFEWNHHTVLRVSERGAAVGGRELPLRMVRGGNEYEFFQPLRPGDVINSKSRVAQVYDKEGRSGKLVFLIGETTYTNQRGELLGTNRETIILLS
jgi:acyl dehydratase